MESKGSAEACRQDLAKQLRERGSLIENAIVERIRALAEEQREENGGDAEELKKVVQVALEHGFRAIEGKEERQPPPEVATHARALAWKAFETHTVLRRYGAGAAVIKEHMRQARSSVKPYSETGYADAERAIERVFDQLQDLVEHEHTQEDKRLKSSPEGRQLEVIRQLLSGELIHPPNLSYDLTATHIGVVGSGAGAEDEIRRLAKILGGQPLVVKASPDQFWAWIGLKCQSPAPGLDEVDKAEWSSAVCIAIGEPAAALEGWCDTHREASAAFAVAIHRPGSVVRYADVHLLTSIARDPLLQRSLRTQFLDPLACERDGGRCLIGTLRKYFAHDRNGVSTSAALGVSPQTITNRLRRAEEYLGRSIAACGIGLEAAVLFAELTS